MAHLKGFGLENFRVFKERTWFDFAPITLLVGPNNSGKSSLIKALLLLKDNYKRDKLRGELKFDGLLHDLSSGESVLNKQSTEKDFSFYIECDSPALTKPVFRQIKCSTNFNEPFFSRNNLVCDDASVLYSKQELDDQNDSVYFDLIKFISLLYNGPIASTYPQYFFNEEKGINSYFKGFREYQNELYKYELRDYLSYLDNLFKSIFLGNYSSEINYSTFLTLAEIDGEEKYDSPIFRLLEANHLFDIKKTITSAKIIDILLLEDGYKNCFNVFGDIAYLPSVKGQTRRWYSAGENEILNGLIKDHRILRLYDDNDEDYESTNQIKWANKFVDKWSTAFGLVDFKIDKEDKFNINFIEANNLSFADQGYGYTQIAALLLTIHKAICTSSLIHSTEPYYLTSSTIVILEEPESNLHPKFQSMLADMLLEAATTTKENAMGVQFIIETHSEYLIRKLQYLTAKNERLMPDDVFIYYFNDPNNIPAGEKQVKKITILEDGSLSDDFGPGFYDEAANWELELLKLKRNKIRQN